VYGKSTQLPYREDGDLVLGATSHIRWSYACSKAIDEFLALAWHRECRLPVTIVRLFNTVGPHQSSRYGMVLQTFIGQALLGEAITVYGNGEQSRCFTHVFDIVAGLAAIAHHDPTIGEIYNLGSTSETSINQLAQAVAMATGSRSPIVHIPYEQAYAPGFEHINAASPISAKRRPPSTSNRAAICTRFLPTQSWICALGSTVVVCPPSRPKLTPRKFWDYHSGSAESVGARFGPQLVAWVLTRRVHG
jgi:nucleoside-diphosphate-sugar epimerase